MPKVSICIPTYKRPDLLKVAVDSCLAQTFQDFEIVISDDSPDTRTEEMVRDISAKQPIRYVRNTPGLGQAKNVNQLFSLAQGKFLTLLHDDDFLTTVALEALLKPLQELNVVAAFGKLHLATHEGTVLTSETEVMNRMYFRTPDATNQIQRSTWSALVQQFPCDGWMARTAAVRATLYRDDPDIGEACDAEFADRLSRLGDFFLVPEYTSVYRSTNDSVSSKGLRVLISRRYLILDKLSVPADLESTRRGKLARLAPVAVNGCLLSGERGNALRILLGRNYPWRREFAKGMVQLALTFAPRAATEMVIKRNSQRKEKKRKEKNGFAGGLYSTS